MISLRTWYSGISIFAVRSGVLSQQKKSTSQMVRSANIVRDRTFFSVNCSISCIFDFRTQSLTIQQRKELFPRNWKGCLLYIHNRQHLLSVYLKDIPGNFKTSISSHSIHSSKGLNTYSDLSEKIVERDEWSVVNSRNNY